MSLSSSISVLQGATGVTLTGGSAVTFANDGFGANGKKTLVDISNADPRTRKKIITGVVVGKPAVGTGLAKLHRQTTDMHQPFVDSKGVAYNLPKNFGMTYHPEQSAAQRETSFWDFIAVIVDAELANLRNLVND